MPTQREDSADLCACADSAALISALLAADDAATRVALAVRSDDDWAQTTYAELSAQATAVQAHLSNLGVQPGDRVVLQDHSAPAWVAVLFGIWRAGGIAVPIDPAIAPNEFDGLVDRCAPRVVITDAATLLTDARSAISLSAAPRAMSDAALIVWTSGTTGTPKGVTLTFGNLAYDVSRAVATQHLSPADRWLSVLPLHHMLEFSCAMLSALATRAEFSFAKTLLPHEIVECMRARRTTHLMTVPLLLRLMRPSIARAKIGPLVLFVGGAPLATSVIESYAAIGIAVYQGYGLTETSPLVTATSPTDNRPGSVGLPLEGTQIRVDADGQLLVRSPALMAGYWGDDELTRAAVSDGWFATGDLGHIDVDGFVYVTGRAKNLIVLESGKNVQAEEVEVALHASPLFAEVCVVGVRATQGDGTGAEQVCAVVVPCAAMSQDEASAEVARVAATLSGYKRPIFCVVEAVELPKSAKRAILRPEVAQLAHQRLKEQLR